MLLRVPPPVSYVSYFILCVPLQAIPCHRITVGSLYMFHTCMLMCSIAHTTLVCWVILSYVRFFLRTVHHTYIWCCVCHLTLPSHRSTLDSSYRSYTCMQIRFCTHSALPSCVGLTCVCLHPMPLCPYGLPFPIPYLDPKLHTLPTPTGHCIQDITWQDIYSNYEH